MFNSTSFYTFVFVSLVTVATPAVASSPRIEQISAQIEKEPQNGWNYRSRAYAFALLGDEVRMEADISKALSLLPNDNGLYNSLGWCYLNIGRPKLASHYWQEALRLSKGQGRSDYYCAALGYFATGDVEKAVSSYDEAVRREPVFGELNTLSERTKDWTLTERQLVQSIYDAWRKGYRSSEHASK